MLGPWRCSGVTNSELVHNLHKSNIIQNPQVREAMLATDRAHYAPSGPYHDSPQPIGYDATISAPHMHAHALELIFPALPRENARVLDVGCGSGVLLAMLARLTGPTGRVFGVEYISQLVELSRRNIERDDKFLLTSGRVQVLLKNGWEGLPEHAPFDAIHVGAAAASVPIKLVQQLRVGGVLVVPIGPEGHTQFLTRIVRTAERPTSTLEPAAAAAAAAAAFSGGGGGWFTAERLLPVVYVPLVDTPARQF